MAEKLSWSVGVGSPGGSINQSGSLDTEAVTLASVSVNAQDSKPLSLQLSQIDKLSFFAVKSSLYSDKLKMKATGAGAPDIKLNGPLLLFGDTIKLLGPSLATITVTNDEPAAPAGAPPADPAAIEIMIGQKLT
jgi:hypothetical protein